jgi:hypothetical protein
MKDKGFKKHKQGGKDYLRGVRLVVPSYQELEK